MTDISVFFTIDLRDTLFCNNQCADSDGLIILSAIEISPK